MNEAPKFLNPDAEISKHGLKLPHWQQDGSTYFLTYRLGDSIPHTKLAKWKEERAIWLRVHPRPWSETEEKEYHRRFSNAIETWLDAGEGSCVLGDARAANEVREVLLAKDGERYAHHGFVVMPNHVHSLVSLGPGESLEKLLKIWKGVSSRKINEALSRSGELWQGNYFDRLIRDQEHFWNCARYIRHNPLKARLPNHRYVLHESPSVKQTLDFKEALKE
jgi:REP element-mobilizing transposase RayT